MPKFSYDQVHNKHITPYGEFKAKAAYVYRQWTENVNRAYDFAMLVISDNEHGSLVNVVGGEGLRTGYPSSVDVTAIGYPGCDPDGRKSCPGQKSISGKTFQLPVNIGLWGVLGEGASGGPWLQEFDPSSSAVTGYVNGVTSQCIPEPPEPVHLHCRIATTITSPYFGDAVWDMFIRAGNQS